MGSDGVSIEAFKSEEETRLDEVYRQLNGGFFRFDVLKHYQEPREGKPPRDIQAPTVKDRIVQKILNQYLYGKYFRGRFAINGVVGSVEGWSVPMVMTEVMKYYQAGYIYVLKTDIINYFPTIDRKRLLKVLRNYITSKDDLNWIPQYLNAAALEAGIPQGPPLSPLMANAYLLSFDKYLRKRKNIRHVRYVDDLLIFCRTKKDAERAYKFVDRKFRAIGLSIHPLGGKTVVDLFDNGSVDALGVIYKDGKLLIKKKKLDAFLNDVVDPLRSPRSVHSQKGKNIGEQVNNLVVWLNHRIIGWGNAYSMCNVADLYKNIDGKIEHNIRATLGALKYPNTEAVVARVKKLSKTKMKPIVK